MTSSFAASILSGLGYEKVYELEGGLFYWMNSGYTLESSN
jgi:rhodanese-related sulfurtransferase